MNQGSAQEHDEHLGVRASARRRNEHLLFPTCCASCRHLGADLKIVVLHIIQKQKN